MTEAEILKLLAECCRTGEVMKNPEIELLESGLMDSLGWLYFMETAEERYGIELQPTMFPISLWKTPKDIVEIVQKAME